MALDFIKELYIPMVLVICLCVGFIAKRWVPTDNKWIPTIVTVLGAVLGCVWFSRIGIEPIAAGAVTGLASTGLHQLFSQLIFPDNAVLDRPDESERADEPEESN